MFHCRRWIPSDSPTFCRFVVVCQRQTRFSSRENGSKATGWPLSCPAIFSLEGKNLTSGGCTFPQHTHSPPHFGLSSLGQCFRMWRQRKVQPLAAKRAQKFHDQRSRKWLWSLQGNTHPKTGPKFLRWHSGGFSKTKYRWDIRKCCMCHQFSRSACFFHLISLE